jgi:hypothetical protein
MACNVHNGVALHDVPTQPLQTGILSVFKPIAFQTFQFNANAVIVTVVSAPVARHAGMPGTVIATDTLPKRAIASNEKMRRHGHPLNLPKGRV